LHGVPVSFRNFITLKQLSMKIRFVSFILLAFILYFHATSSTSQTTSPTSPLISSPVHQFTNYDNLWQKVDSLSNLGLPKSAIEVVSAIYNLAKKEKNDPQFIKSIMYKLKLQSEFQEDFHTTAISDLNKEIFSAQEPVKQILQSILAEVYWKYYQNNRYRFNDRTQLLNNDKDSIQTWDLNKLSRQIIKCYMVSLKNPGLLKSIPISDFDTIIEKPESDKGGSTGNIPLRKPSQTGPSRSLRPTLYDFIAWRALEYFMSNDGPKNVSAENFRIDNPIYFLQATQFTGMLIMLPSDSTSLESFAIKIFRDLAAFHLADKDPGALIDEELQRFEFIWQNAAMDGKDSLYMDAMKNLEQTHLSSPHSTYVSYAIARFLFDQGSQYKREVSDKHKWDLKTAFGFCENAIDRFPESNGAKNCKSLLEQIKEMTLRVSSKEEVIPEQPSLASVEFKNLNTVYFRLVKTDPEKDMDDRQYTGQEAMLNYYLGLPVYKAWSQQIPNDTDYRQHLCDVAIPSVPKGYYIILISSGKDFLVKKDVIAFTPFFSTQISYVSQKNDKGGIDIYVLDRETGKPMKNVTVEVFLKKYDYRTRKNVSTKTGNYLTDPEGFLSVPGLQKGDYSAAICLRLTCKDDLYLTNTFSRNYNPDINKTPGLQTFFFLDRAIYRPGQTIYFKGLILEKTGEKQRIKPGETTIVTFKDVNAQEVSHQTFTTNDFGSFNGSFVAPQGILSGQMSISNGSGSATFQVEEYKRPTFEVTFDPLEGNYRLNDSITVTGKAMAFAGNNIDGAMVKYRVVRATHFPYMDRWWYPFPVLPEVEIAQGETKTGSKGDFTLHFKAIPDASLDKNNNPVFNYTVYADVTDINGETRSSEVIVSVGYSSLLIGMNIPEKMNLLKDTVFKLSSTNLNERPTPAEVTVRIQRLRQPERFFRSRITQSPDLTVMTREEFYTQFPYDIYKNDDDPGTWPVEETVLERIMNSGTDSILNIRDQKSISMKPGIYVLLLQAKDPYGNPVEIKKYFTAFDPSVKEMPVYALNWFVPLKTECEPGETAQFLIGSKENISVIYEIRVHDSLLSRQWLKLNNNQVKIEVPVKEEYRGNFVVNFVFVKYNRSFQNSEVVKVPFSNKKLDLVFESFRNKLIPGGKEEWKIRINNASGKGADAEFLASMYDESLDAFRPNQWEFSIYPSYSWNSAWAIGETFGVSSGFGYNENPGYPFFSREYDQLNWFGLNYFGGRSIYMKSGRLMEDRAMSADMGGVPAAKQAEESTTTNISSSKGQEPGIEKKSSPSLFQIRKDFRETAFFYPSLVTDSAGNLSVSFTVPESLTRWKILGFAHTKQLDFGLMEKSAVTQKDLMVFPNSPRFVRQGDTVIFSAKTVNLSNRTLTGEVTLEFFDAITLKPVNVIENTTLTTKSYSFLIKPGMSSSFQWKIVIPVDPGLSVLQYRIVAKAGSFSDGEEKAIPVLANRMMVTETLPLPVRGKGSFEFKFNKLLQSSSAGSLKNYKLTLEFASNPAWYAVQALPYLDDPRYPNADNIFNAFYANSIASHIANSNPKIKMVFESWKNLTPDALLSNLEKNQQLKSALLQETPWVMEGKSESERKQRLGLLFDLNTVSSKLDQNLNKLIKLQSANGGWPWFEGMPENRYITQNLVTGLGHLDHLGVNKGNVKSAETWNMLVKAIEYLDGELIRDYENIKKYYPGKMDDNHLSPTQVQYLYARSYFIKDIPLNVRPNKSAIQVAFDYFKKQAEKYWLKQDVFSQGMIALALNRFGNKDIPAAILKSMSEKALHSTEMGMYWAVNSGYEWYQAPVETQSMLIEAYDEVAADQKSVDEMKIWLLKQKQTQDWKTGRATVEACYALLLRGMDLLATDPEVKINVGKETIDPQKLQDTKTEAGTGYFQVSWTGKEITPDMGNVKVTKSGEGVAWGALYWQYFEDLDKITPAKTPLKLEKKLFKEINTSSGPILEEITKYEVRSTKYELTSSPVHQFTSSLSVGDKIKVRIILTVDRNLEFVHMKDMRASAFEPYSSPTTQTTNGSQSNELSGYRYQDGLGYYQSTTDVATNFFFDYLPKGTWVFEYPLVVNAAGYYSNGITTVQCMYAPEFAAHSEGIRVKVNE
jgi:hypothetical protein